MFKPESKLFAGLLPKPPPKPAPKRVIRPMRSVPKFAPVYEVSQPTPAPPPPPKYQCVHQLTEYERGLMISMDMIPRDTFEELGFTERNMMRTILDK